METLGPPQTFQIHFCSVVYRTDPAAGHQVRLSRTTVVLNSRQAGSRQAVQRNEMSTGNDVYPDLSKVPSCYRDLKEAVNKKKAMSLPPHRPFDCAIDLLPGAPIPKWRLSISGPGRAAMDEYLASSLKAGIIRPSSSPAGAGFFFVG